MGATPEQNTQDVRDAAAKTGASSGRGGAQMHVKNLKKLGPWLERSTAEESVPVLREIAQLLTVARAKAAEVSAKAQAQQQTQPQAGPQPAQAGAAGGGVPRPVVQQSGA